MFRDVKLYIGGRKSYYWGNAVGLAEIKDLNNMNINWSSDFQIYAKLIRFCLKGWNSSTKLYDLSIKKLWIKCSLKK